MRPGSYRGIFALAFVCVAAMGIEFVRSATDPDAEARTTELAEAVGALAAGPTSAGREGLPLSDEERAQIFDAVMRTADVPVVDVEPPEGAAALPAWVALQDLPTGVAQEIPLVDGHKFVKLDDRILLIDPDSRTVVAEMPRYKLALQ